jgi:hypothetical protein
MTPCVSPDARRAALIEHARLSAELATPRAAANKERQLNRRVDLNLAIRRRENELQALTARL